MPAADADLRDDSPPPPPRTLSQLPFPPVTRSDILNCSVHKWLPQYKTLTPKTRLIPLSPSFLAYLRSDGIILPPHGVSPDGGGDNELDSSDDDEDQGDPSVDWPEIHVAVKSTIQELGGRVHPKLNWSAPKDATWIAATNSMECASANDIYLLLKSSDFITHDLEQAFDGCAAIGESVEAKSEEGEEIPFHLVLRKSIPAMITSMEFRCFVRRRRIIGICQRELNHYDFLPSLVPTLQDLIIDFFEEKLQTTFPNENFVFDVYIPQPDSNKGRVWLIDINPWAPRTDPLIFSWLELLTMPDLPLEEEEIGDGNGNELQSGFLRLSMRPSLSASANEAHAELNNTPEAEEREEEEEEEELEELPYRPEFRLVKRDDPEAYSFNTPLYSAHKLPKDLVDASTEGGGGLRDFLARWNEARADAQAGGVSDSE